MSDHGTRSRYVTYYVSYDRRTWKAVDESTAAQVAASHGLSLDDPRTYTTSGWTTRDGDGREWRAWFARVSFEGGP